MMKMAVAGEFNFETTGKITRVGGDDGSSGKFKNLIVNNGYLKLKTLRLDEVVFSLKIGSGTNEASVSDSALQVDHGKTIPVSTASTCIVDPGDPNTLIHTTVFRYSHDTAAINVTELAIYTKNSNGIFSRALAKDSGGSPLSIALDRGNVLIVTYVLRITSLPADTQYNHTVDYTGNNNPNFSSIIRLSTKPWMSFGTDLTLMPRLMAITDATARTLNGSSALNRAEFASFINDLSDESVDPSSTYWFNKITFPGNMINVSDPLNYIVETTGLLTEVVNGGPNGIYTDSSVSYTIENYASGIDRGVSTLLLGYGRSFSKFYPMGVITLSVPYPVKIGYNRKLEGILRVSYI